MITKIFLDGNKTNVVSVRSVKDFYGKPYVWIRAVEPTNEEISLIAKVVSLDELAVEDLKSFLVEGDRSRVEKDSFLQIIYSVPIVVNKELETEEVMFFSKKGLVITIERKKLAICKKFQERAENNKGKYLFTRNTGFFVTELIDEADARFLRHVNQIESRIDVLSSLGKPLTTDQINAVASANNTLSVFNRSSLANLEVLTSLKKMYHSTFLPENREVFADMYFDALQVMDAQRVQREMIMNLFNIQSIISSNRTNLYMNKLTALALIIMVPTLMSGIYGMNVRGLPFAQNDFGFWFILGSLIVITFGLYLWFKKSDWV